MIDLPEVIGVPGIGYLVSSKSHDGYWVIVHGKTCSGEHCRDRQSCRHRRLVAELVAEQNRKHARPVAPPAISMLVD